MIIGKDSTGLILILIVSVLLLNFFLACYFQNGASTMCPTLLFP